MSAFGPEPDLPMRLSERPLSANSRHPQEGTLFSPHCGLGATSPQLI